MEVRVQGPLEPSPFLSARDVFETRYDLEHPVYVYVRDDPDERTWTSHHDGYHTLNISKMMATSAMATELTLHEYAHMHRYEHAHPSHTQSTEEALYLALAGRHVERRKVTHCYQIANHMKDIYADDLTLSVGPADKLVAFLESSLAAAIADTVYEPPRPNLQRVSNGSDPDIVAVNAAFALALVERHDLVDEHHRIYELASVTANDAPDIPFERFRTMFKNLVEDPDESEYRKSLVDATQSYVDPPTQALD